MEVGQVEIAVYATLGGCLMCIKHTDHTEEAYISGSSPDQNSLRHYP